MRCYDSNCICCNKAISNPVCPECLAKQMSAWLSEHDDMMANQIEGFDSGGDVTCIFCGKGMNICANCYSMDVYNQLLDWNRDVAKEFASRFDFDLRKSVLSRAVRL